MKSDTADQYLCLNLCVSLGLTCSERVRLLVGYTFDTLLEERGPEIDKEAQTKVEQADVGQDLFPVNRCKLFSKRKS
jgi:hypothetical protein